jgi:ubiquinone biosynthesis UbiH/UbiF/VisC/COQ6 family hydroxylase
MTASIVVAGGGPIGLAFALASATLPRVTVTVVEREQARTHALAEDFDHRVLALSPATQAFLAALGVWQRLPPERLAPIRAMHVFGDDGGEMDMSQGAPLAFVVEHATLMNALKSAVDAATDRIQWCEGSITRLVEHGSAVTGVRLQDGRTLASQLLVGADGSRSQVRQAAGIDIDSQWYDSEGVVANFRVERPHGDVARQWFSPEGVLAYLPLPDRRISIVWSVSVAKAAELAALSPDALCRAVEAAGHHALGGLQLASPVARFPLQRTSARQWTREGLALIGDAAHAIHPLAGQGANLGFGDAEALTDCLRGRSPLSRLGDKAVLRRYERARREPAAAMAAATDRLRALFLAPSTAAQWARNRGLSAVDRLPLAKRLFMDYATRRA